MDEKVRYTSYRRMKGLDTGLIQPYQSSMIIESEHSNFKLAIRLSAKLERSPPITPINAHENCSESELKLLSQIGEFNAIVFCTENPTHRRPQNYHQVSADHPARGICRISCIFFAITTRGLHRWSHADVAQKSMLLFMIVFHEPTRPTEAWTSPFS